MKTNLLRWCIAAVMLILIVTFFSTPALAEVQPLPLDMKVTGRELPASGWISENEYQDESIHIIMQEKNWKPKYSNDWVMCRWVRIKIKDPTQLRTTLSFEDYSNPEQSRPKDMAAKLNSVVACNDDFVKYKYDASYVVRQGEEYRKKPNGKWDVLIIDDQGDFSFVKNATEKTLDEKLSELEAAGRKVINAFSFGKKLDRAIRVLSHVENDLKMEIKSKNGSRWIAADAVAYIEVRSHEVCIHTGQETIRQWGTLAQYETQLKPLHFIRCNASFLVNPKYVRTVVRDQAEVAGDLLPISRTFRKDFLNTLAQYKGGTL